MNLPSKAEQQADLVRNLPSFQKFSLLSVRTTVSDLLAAIGKIEGIFITYTRHDIQHIDTMLSMLDWLIPPSTSRTMTPVDWLLVVLSIYFHDLGMVVTQGEYEERDRNQPYRDWVKALLTQTDGPEFLDRMSRMTEMEKERFLFQEYVRSGHARRTREWITGRHSRFWGREVQPISSEIASLLNPLSSRFREYLGLICESHHNSDPENTEYFPLCARLGNHPQELVNVQYAAVLLRTADLLHVSRDRTPSVMYKLIRFSDPKSVEEWDKQRGVFSVGPQGRTLREDDPDSAVIIISADFVEERPLFALQEYVAYAHQELQQSGRWIEKSRRHPDGSQFSFPWHTIKSDIRLEGIPPQPLSFELDRGRLLDLLVGHTIYNDPTVAVRELLQNALDAVRYQHYLEKRNSSQSGRTIPPIGKIEIHWNPETRVLRIKDDGIGMDKDVIKYHLMRVGASFYSTPKFDTEFKDFSPISRFGIGILTCFMVSDDIEIVTCKDNKGFRVKMTSVHSDYLLRELHAGDPKLEGLDPHGTRVTIRIRGTVDLERKSVRDILDHWVILPECSVEFTEEEKEPVAIGFRSVKDALAYYHTPPVLTERQILVHSGQSEIRSCTHETEVSGNEGGCSTVRYELAYAVRKGFTPEWHFARQPSDHEGPLVCIEGIRVSNRLPWFGSQRLSCLLAVSGDRAFRTTVARSGLEEDSEFDRVGEICGRLLFRHIDAEVSRISEKEGHPLSQAASAAQWLTFTLDNAADRPAAKDLIRKLADELPSIVVERLEIGVNESPTSRRLISPCALRDEEIFWTVESRLVDSLGTISRDLGRELSLHEFLSALAPGYKEMHFSPLVLDAHLVKNLFEKHYCPAEALFSKQHQQTAVRWQTNKGITDGVSLSLREVCGESYFRQVLNAISSKERARDDDEYMLVRWAHGRRMDPREAIELSLAPVHGDDDRISGVVTRVGLILKAGSTPAQDWLTIRQEIVRLASQEVMPDALIQVFNSAAMFIQAISSGSRQILPAWRSFLPQVNETLSSLSCPICFPKDISEYIEAFPIFDASSYWWDWLSGKRHQ